MVPARSADAKADGIASAVQYIRCRKAGYLKNGFLFGVHHESGCLSSNLERSQTETAASVEWYTGNGTLLEAQWLKIAWG